jgi:serine/threonine-protein kinase
MGGAHISGLGPGTIVDQKYRVERTIGGGAMSSVYLATRLPSDGEVALKMLHPWLIDERREVDRLFREAKTIVRLEHPGCVRLFDWGMHDEALPYLVLEHVRGASLQDALDRETRFAVDRALLIGVQLCHVLNAAHQLGIVHRDLKPDNIMLCEGERETVKVLDFGLARVMPHARHAEDTVPKELTQPGSILGTLTHMAPEIAGGVGTADARSDIYSLGVVLYELITGELPLLGATQIATLMMVTTMDPPPMSQHLPEVHPNLDRIVMRCLEKDPRRRWQSAVDIATALLTLEGAPTAIGDTVTNMIPFGDDDETILKKVGDSTPDVALPPVSDRAPQVMPEATAVEKRGVGLLTAIVVFVMAVGLGVVLVLLLTRV